MTSLPSDDIDDPKVAFVGSELTIESGQDSTLSRLSAVPSRSVLSRITDHYMQIIANQGMIQIIPGGLREGII